MMKSYLVFSNMLGLVGPHICLLMKFCCAPILNVGLGSLRLIFDSRIVISHAERLAVLDKIHSGHSRS
ncbi:hypothetical protein EB796_008937 [Bugula neritina]|uniref:Uncharacterized protein n=1 Tax=Bugula neritina TaxID=10212 RepID=A0A7J7K282_BUGNE|nr:hypothetical protein EB796_008937 [Bugula neritina]